MSKELAALEVLKQLKDFVYEFESGNVDKLFVEGLFDIIETALKRIPELEKEIEDTHKAYSMAIEKLIKDKDEYIKWVQEGGYDGDKVEVFEIIRDNFDLWVEPKYKATLQFLQCCSLTQSDYEKLINYFGGPRDE